MPTYITAKGIELSVSKTANSWPTGTSAAEIQQGTAKNDIFHSTASDTLVGGLGDDTYTLWGGGETIVEKANEGIDTVDSRVWGAVTLADNVENLFLNSAGSTAGTGNALNNIIVAGTVGATLDGKGGDDVLVGGSGADLFKVSAGNGSDTIMNFKSSSDVVQLSGYNVTSFEQLKSLAVQSGADVKFSFANGESLVMRGVNLGDLTAYDFGLQSTAAQAAAGLSTLLGPAAAVSDNGFYVLNNVWNPGTLVSGTDYSISSSYSASDLTANTTFNWSFPVVTESFTTIRAYPELIFGPAPMSGGAKVTDVAGVFPVQVSAVANLTADYDVTYKGNTDGFNVSFDIWLTDTPNGGPKSVTNEIMVWVHKGGLTPFGKLVGTYTDGDITGKIYSSDSGDWTYTAIVLDQDVPKGRIDIDSILAKLQSLGIVSGNEYVASVELGAEVASGAGQLTINNLDLTLQTVNSEKVLTATGTGVTTTTAAVTKPSTDASVTPPATVVDLSGDNRITYDPTAKAVAGGAGQDTLVLKTSATVELGNFSSSQIAGSAYVSGFEDVDASAANGAVTLNGSQYNNNLTGGAYTDTLSGGAGFDKLYGGAGDDFLNGGEGIDWLQGDAGNDRIVYDAADSVIDGGAGRDVLLLSGAATVNLGNFSTSQVAGGNAYVMGFEDADASGSTAAVTLNGSQYNNLLIGGSGADTLSGGAGFDTLNGGDGNDIIDGGADIDQLRGEAGDDRIAYDSADSFIDGGAGRDTLVLKGAAVVNLGNFSTSQVLGGSAYVTGFENADASGSSAAVSLTGSQYANELIGGAGADTLIGGAGSDTLTGGAGADIFRFDKFGAGDLDVITDFSGDKIDLSLIDAIAGGSDNAFTYIGASAFHKVAGELHYINGAGGLTVQGDINGDGVADFSIHLKGASSLAAGDFIF